MIDINLLRNDVEKFKKATANKLMDPAIVDMALQLDEQWRKILSEVEELRAQKNKAAKEKDVEAGKKVKGELKKAEEDLKKLEEERITALNKIPNPAAPDVKVGKNDKENEIVRKWGEPTKFDFKPLDHLDIGEKLDIIDVKRASKVSGARFGYLKGDAVLLEFALANYAFEILTARGFIPVVPPVLIKQEMMGKMGYLENDGIKDMYAFDEDGLVLVGTSEQSIGPLHAGEVLPKLPVRYAGFSSCFRREAGSYGLDTKGILRVHQFDKVEMFVFTDSESSDKEHEYLLGLEEKIFQGLGIPYQITKMCTGDVGMPFTRKYDLNAWMPAQDTYREVTSTSNATDFQSRRLDIKYSNKGKLEYVHMLNGTAIAIGRTIIAILENYQQKDGSVKVPKVLQKWMGKEIIKKL